MHRKILSSLSHNLRSHVNLTINRRMDRLFKMGPNLINTGQVGGAVLGAFTIGTKWAFEEYSRSSEIGKAVANGALGAAVGFGGGYAGGLLFGIYGAGVIVAPEVIVLTGGATAYKAMKKN